MYRVDFITKLANSTGYTKEQTKKLLGATENAILELMATDDSIMLKFGRIGGKVVPPHEGLDFKTGQRKIYPEKHGVPFYKASKQAKDC